MISQITLLKTKLYFTRNTVQSFQISIFRRNLWPHVHDTLCNYRKEYIFYYCCKQSICKFKQSFKMFIGTLYTGTVHKIIALTEITKFQYLDNFTIHRTLVVYITNIPKMK